MLHDVRFLGPPVTAYEACQAALPPGVMYFRDPCTDAATGLPITEYNPVPVPVNPNHIEADMNPVPMMVAAVGAFMMLKG